MNYLMKPILIMILGFTLSLTACQEDTENLAQGSRNVLRQPVGPGDKVINPGNEPYAYPNIIEKYYPARLANYQGTKAWRIEWPEYSGDIDPDQIPTFFATSTGGLNSLKYINSIDPLNKKKLSFSLFNGTRLKAAAVEETLWGGGAPSAEAVYFGKIDKSLGHIKDWVTTRPSAFELNWENTEDLDYDVEYQEGDFFIYQIPGLTPIQYGGIRIVSENPRIIEVYHAVNN